MEVMIILVPLALGLGLVGLIGFLWSLKSGQYDDLDGAAWRAFADDEPAAPETPPDGAARAAPKAIWSCDKARRTKRRKCPS
jgi:cbb3-type cytochrome oxidase maturation protein